jgi:hypothetical protein
MHHVKKLENVQSTTRKKKKKNVQITIKRQNKQYTYSLGRTSQRILGIK